MRGLQVARDESPKIGVFGVSEGSPCSDLREFGVEVVDGHRISQINLFENIGFLLSIMITFVARLKNGNKNIDRIWKYI